MTLVQKLAAPWVPSILALVAACSAPASSGATRPNSFAGVGDLPGNAYSSLAHDATLDGDTVVGESLADEPDVADDYEGEAFVWERASGIHPLGYLPPIPGSTFDISSVAYAISSEGSVAVGDSRYEIGSGVGEHEAVRWSERIDLRPGARTGVVGPPLALGFLSGGNRSAAFSTSNHGAVIVGFSRALEGTSSVERAFVWTDPVMGGSGMQALDAGNAGTGAVRANDVSDDGSIIVGFVPSSPGASSYSAVYWEKSATGYTLSHLPDPPQSAQGTFACSVSGDGRTIAGNRIDASGVLQPCRWQRVHPASPISSGASGSPSEKWKVDLLGLLKNDAWSTVVSPSRAVSFDGAIVVGISGSDTDEQAFVWDATHGMRKLADVLTSAGVTAHQTWSLSEAWSVSGDASHGYTIVGGGMNPSHQWEGWVAHLAASWL